MPNSTARRAHRHIAFTTGFVFLVGLNTALLPSPVYSADPTPVFQPSGPPQQITAPFSDQDNFIERLRRQGVADGEARAIDKIIRASLTPAQRKSGALIQLSFGGDGWPWTLQSLSIEPVHGAVVLLDRSKVMPPETTQETAQAPAPKPVSVQPSATAKPVAAANDPFTDVNSTSKLSPNSGNIDPEWPVQAPKAATPPVPANQKLTAMRGAVNGDVAQSLQKAGLPPRLASEVAQAIAAHAPLRNAQLNGSRFNVAYDPLLEASSGFILAEFAVGGVNHRLWRYRPDGGVTGFYTDDGVRIGGLAMQSPIPGSPIVSPYGMRKHPVLRVNKMHWGVDYAANTGTPILAAADGIIEDVRRLGNYGLYIRVSHADGVETTYGHLSRFEPSVPRGTPVKAGQVIGYAGRSGLASGPHLYFEVFVEGKRVDPEHMVSDEPLRLADADLALFERLKQQATAIQAAQR